MGSEDGASDEKPAHEVDLASFCIDLAEVTADAYAACRSCSAPDTGTRCNFGVSGRGSHPVNCVDWDQATAYCDAQGKRLPTEQEWEYAARGGSAQRKYPWDGDADPNDQLCWRRSDGTCVVGSHPKGDTPEGIHDLAGNVWEWTSSRKCPYDQTDCLSSARVVRGGSWYGVVASVVRGATRSDLSLGLRDVRVGFRCAKPAH